MQAWGGVETKEPSVGGVWIFFGTTHTHHRFSSTVNSFFFSLFFLPACYWLVMLDNLRAAASLGLGES